MTTVTLDQFKTALAAVAPTVAMLPMHVHDADSPTLGVDHEGRVHVNPSLLPEVGPEQFVRLICREVDLAVNLSRSRFFYGRR